MGTIGLDTPFTPRSGTALPNRIVKAAMEEQLADVGQLPGPGIRRLYERWAQSGAGLLITGHVMVDRRAVAQPGDIVLEEDTPLDGFVRWAAAAKSGGARIWMQINHPGRVVLADTRGVSWAPSAVPVRAGLFSRFFAPPVAMTQGQIEETIVRFAATARAADRAGFDGVEVHAAHGYLLSQFLSPLVNHRTGRWGGSLRNRARLLVEVVRRIRSATRPGFAVAVKLNSADFQRGGFDLGDAGEVIGMLANEGVDLVELSGGSVESLATSGTPADGRTLAREAYFLDLAADLVDTAEVPLMLTGGIRRRSVAQRVLDGGFDLVGVATAFATDPGLARRWLDGDEEEASVPRSSLCSKALRAAAVQAATTARIHRMAAGHPDRSGDTPLRALLADRIRRGRQLRGYRCWIRGRVSTAPAPVAGNP
ncbi:MAG: 2,4-dienoyl-CoA reductase [Nocardiopsaceae bacterium]|nr:2,4-dienoyl-CoA reductase [Nocardiopsaceae bacterium]